MDMDDETSSIFHFKEEGDSCSILKILAFDWPFGPILASLHSQIIFVDGQTDRQTDRQTDTHSKTKEDQEEKETERQRLNNKNKQAVNQTA